MKTTAQYLKKFGTPNQTGTGYLVSMDVPFPLRIAWDTKTTVKKIKVHKDIAVPLRKVFDDLLNVYGYEKIKELGIDLFGGVFNYRQMRGGSSWSVHAWGLAIDRPCKKYTSRN